jgi:hypothetical protein
MCERKRRFDALCAKALAIRKYERREGVAAPTWARDELEALFDELAPFSIDEALCWRQARDDG